jgi:hypothetical protein
VKQQRYWVALFNRGGERAGVERELAREPRLEVARARYNESVATYPDPLSDALRPRHRVGAERSKHDDTSGRMSSEAILS